MQPHIFPAALLILACALGACDGERSTTPSEDVAEEKKSIFRPEFQVEPIEGLQPAGSLQTRIVFPDGAELTQEARAELATVLASPQMAEGGDIILGGHSDSGGSDEANMRASRARADAVREWLVENGIAEDRITVIAFGEQNPAAPNALPDGTPNEEGRTTNRRVEIEVQSPGQSAQDNEAQTLAESLAAARDVDKEEASDKMQ